MAVAAAATSLFVDVSPSGARFVVAWKSSRPNEIFEARQRLLVLDSWGRDCLRLAEKEMAYFEDEICIYVEQYVLISPVASSAVSTV